MSTPKKWKLHMGCHRGTVTSRDAGPPEELDSLNECKRRFIEIQLGWARSGYSVWYANAVSPDGERHTLHHGTPYTTSYSSSSPATFIRLEDDERRARRGRRGDMVRQGEEI